MQSEADAILHEPSPIRAVPSPSDESYPQTRMRVRKRNGSTEPVEVEKIVRAVTRCCGGLRQVDPMRIATKTISGLYDGATTKELDMLSILTASALIIEEPQYSQLAARLLSTYIDKEVRNQEIHAFSQSIVVGHNLGRIADRMIEFVSKHARKLNDAIAPERDREFEYFGMRTLYDRYLLRHPKTRQVIETPQQFFMRIACALAETIGDAITLYDTFSRLEYIPGSPTLFNAGTRHEQLSSCFLLDSPQDDLAAIFDRNREIGLLSKFSGGIGLAYHRVRSLGSLISSTNGLSNGIVPFLKMLDSSVAAVNQGGRRKGACCVYLEPWHADIEEFLELRDDTGDEARRTHNLNLANWIPDLFMQRVEQDATWSLFDPKIVPDLPDLWGEAFSVRYEQAERDGLAEKTVRARDLYARMMRTLAETGNGWMCFKDAANRKSNQTATIGKTIHLSNLCTEILEVTSNNETAVCTLGSINLGRHIRIDDGKATFDFPKLGDTVKTAVRQLNRVIDLNYYPIDSAKQGNTRWRPIGLGVMGLQDVFFRLRLPFDSEEARALSKKIAEFIYFCALEASVELASKDGPHLMYEHTRACQGELQFDAWPGTELFDGAMWHDLRRRIAQFGLRNSLLIAIAPTATIASIAGCYECIEPQVSNLFKRETLSGDFLQVNRYLVADLQAIGRWDETMRNRIKLADGSIQAMDDLPEELRAIYRTAWEIPMRSLIDMAAERGPFVDQSQSLNLFVQDPSIGPLSSMYFYAWRRGIKTTYYLRSRPATKIAKTTVTEEPSSAAKDAAAVKCSLENPQSCEACQ